MSFFTSTIVGTRKFQNKDRKERHKTGVSMVRGIVVSSIARMANAVNPEIEGKEYWIGQLAAAHTLL